MSDRQLSPFVKIVRAMADQSPRRVRAIMLHVAAHRSATCPSCHRGLGGPAAAAPTLGSSSSPMNSTVSGGTAAERPPRRALPSAFAAALGKSRLHRSATLGRKPVREHQRLGAAVAVGRITLWYEDPTPTHGYEPTRDAAMAAFAKGVVLRPGNPLSGAIWTLSRHRRMTDFDPIETSGGRV